MPSIAFLIDGDGRGLSQIEAAFAALRGRGNVVSSTIFTAPGMCSANRKWAEFLKKHRICVQEVVRSGTKDPNDVALGNEAIRLASSQHIDCVALLVEDNDYVPIFQHIEQLGKALIVVLPNQNRPGLMQQLERIGITVVIAESYRTKPRVQAVLQADGTGSIQVLETPASSFSSIFSRDQVESIAQRLHELGYFMYSNPLNTSSLSSSIAQFWHANRLGALVVYPNTLAFRSLIELLQKETRGDWRSNQLSTAYVLPVSSRPSNKGAVKRYGSSKAASIAAGGGPFMIENTVDMVEHFFYKMGYMDTTLNTSLEEAAWVFSNASLNKRNLRQFSDTVTGERSPSFGTEVLKRAMLSTLAVGEWQLPPSDDVARKFLLSKKLIPNDRVPRADVFDALKFLLKKKGLPVRETYNANLAQFSAHITAKDPLRRE